MIVDPIVSTIAGDSHKNAETRRALAPLVDLAQRHGCALLGITHFTKGTAGRDPLERVTGSLAFGALARVVMATARRPDDHPDGPARLLVRTKSNIGPDGDGFHYQIEETELDDHPGLFATHSTWIEPIEGTARALLASAEIDPNDDNRSVSNEAERFLRSLLADGPMEVSEVQKQAKAVGISRKCLRTARERLGIRTNKIGFKSGWEWEFPHEYAQGAQQNKRASSGTFVTEKASSPEQYSNSDDSQSIMGTVIEYPRNGKL